MHKLFFTVCYLNDGYVTFSTSYSVMDFTDPTKNEFYVHDQELFLDVGTADTLLALVSGINRASSRVPPALPEWIYNGAIIASQAGTQSVTLKQQKWCRNGFIHVIIYRCSTRFSSVGITESTSAPCGSKIGQEKSRHRLVTVFSGTGAGTKRFTQVFICAPSIPLSLHFHEFFFLLQDWIPRSLIWPVRVSKWRSTSILIWMQRVIYSRKRIAWAIWSNMWTMVRATDKISVDFWPERSILPIHWLASGTLVNHFDLSNSFFSRTWKKTIVFAELIKSNIIQPGFKGFMADFGEYTPLDAVTFNNTDPFKFHNELPVFWASTVRYSSKWSWLFSKKLQ